MILSCGFVTGEVIISGKPPFSIIVLPSGETVPCQLRPSLWYGPIATKGPEVNSPLCEPGTWVKVIEPSRSTSYVKSEESFASPANEHNGHDAGLNGVGVRIIVGVCLSICPVRPGRNVKTPSMVNVITIYTPLMGTK